MTVFIEIGRLAIQTAADMVDQLPDPPQDLVTLQWIIIGALVTAIGVLLRQYLINERACKDDLKEIRQTILNTVEAAAELSKEQSKSIAQLREEIGLARKLDQLLEKRSAENTS